MVNTDTNPQLRRTDATRIGISSRTPEVEHVLYCGTTRYGKTQAAIRFIVSRIGFRDSPAMVVIDPAGGMARKIAMHAIRKGLAGKLIYDQVRETSNVPGYDFLTASDNPDPDQREAENRERVSEMVAILLRAEGKLDASANPMIEEGLAAALSLFINQRKPVPFYWLKDCFTRESDAFQYLLANCTHPDTAMKFEYYAALNLRDWEYKCGPAYRRLQLLCNSPQFKRRCIPTFDYSAFMETGGIHCVDGESKGNLSRQDFGAIAGAIILRLIQLKRAGKIKRHVILVIDEGTNARLIDGNIARALAEAAKWGLEIHLIVQNPLGFPTPEIQDSCFQNCNTTFLFKQVNHAAAMFGANIVAVPNLEPLKVRYTETRYRSVETDMIEIPTESTSVSKGPDGEEHTSVTKGKQFRTKREDVAYEVDHHWSLDDQIKLAAQQISNLGVGHCFIRKGNNVTKSPVYIPLLEDPWTNSEGKALRFSKTQTLGDRKLEQALAVMRTRPEFQPPVVESLTWKPPKSRGAASRLRGGSDES